MGYSNILVALSGASDDRIVLTAAAELAKQSKGVVRILMALPVEAAAVWADAFGGAFLTGDTMQAISEANIAIRAKTTRVAGEVAETLGLKFGEGAGGGRIQIIDPAETAWFALIREAPMADLVIIGDSMVRADGFWSGVGAEALMLARLPVLIIRSKRPMADEVVAIAWDGSMPAGRAVRAAMPLLKAASRVVILQDPAGLTAAERDAGSPDALRDQLMIRGVAAPEIKEITRGPEGDGLLEAAASVKAGLIISGAYGHSRLGEAIFGGATRAFVQAHSGVHHFLAH